MKKIAVLWMVLALALRGTGLADGVLK